MTKYFCCCIPVRFGVFVMSTLSLLSTGTLAGILWYIVIEGSSPKFANLPPLPTESKLAYIIFAAVLTLIALLSLFGLLGALLRKLALVRLYSILIWIALLADIAVGVWYIIEMIHHVNAADDICTELNKADTCMDSTSAKAGFIAGLSVEILIQLYACIIVSRYVSQLKEERVWTSRPIPQTEAQVPLMNVQSAYQGPSYPYAKVEHSFGHTV